VSGFGSVFTDVDLASTTGIQYFDQGNASLGTFFADAQNLGLSFVGVSYNTPTISRVRVTLGNAVIGASDSRGTDVVVADDFIYGEPVAATASSAPEPGALAFVAIGGMLILSKRRRK
jgi:hypothetical protein